MKHKLLSLLLLLVALLQGNVARAIEDDENIVAEVNGTEYATFDDALAAAKNISNTSADNPATITLKKDCVTTGFTINQSNQHINITGGTHTLTMGGSAKIEDGSLAITDGTFKATSDVSQDLFYVNGGNLTVNGGKFTGSYYGLGHYSGNVTLNGGTFSGSNGGIYDNDYELSSILGDGKGYYEESGDHWVSYTGDMNSNCIDKTVKIAPSGSLGTGIVFNDAEAYSKNSDTKYDWLEYNRTYWDNDWNCLYIPFRTKASNFTDCAVYDINMFQQYDNNNDGDYDKMTLEVIKLKDDATVKANHPYLIKYLGDVTEEQMKNGKNVSIMFTDVTQKAAKTEQSKVISMSYKYIFQGTYFAIDAAAAVNYYTLVYYGGKMILGKTNNGVKAQRWYMTMTPREGSSNARDMEIDIEEYDGETEGIEEIRSSETQDDLENRIYTVSGQRLSEPRHGQINIIGGKKVFVE